MSIPRTTSDVSACASAMSPFSYMEGLGVDEFLRGPGLPEGIWTPRGATPISGRPSQQVMLDDASFLLGLGPPAENGPWASSNGQGTRTGCALGHQNQQSQPYLYAETRVLNNSSEQNICRTASAGVLHHHVSSEAPNRQHQQASAVPAPAIMRTASHSSHQLPTPQAQAILSPKSEPEQGTVATEGVSTLNRQRRPSTRQQKRTSAANLGPIGGVAKVVKEESQVVSEDIVVTLLGVGIYAGALARRAALQSINQRNMKRYQEAQHAAAVATQ